MMAIAIEKRIGQILVDNGVIDPLDLEQAMQEHRMNGEFVGRILVRMGACTEQEVVESLGIQAGMEKVELSKMSLKEETLRKISPHIARFYSIVPVRIEDDGETLVVATADPLNVSIIDDLEHMLGMRVKGAISNIEDITKALQHNYSYEAESVQEVLQELVRDADLTADRSQELARLELPDVESLAALAQEPEVIKMVNLVLLDALQKRASDIHFEPYEDEYRIRLRIDGTLYEVVTPPKEIALAITSRLKIISDLDIAERRMPQDGRIQLSAGGTNVDIRVSTLPTLHGESVVLRILDRTQIKLDLDTLGFEPRELELLRQIIRKPMGIVLSTGPTGCGKTTTLYSCLNEINDPQVKIITTEDPIEFPLDRIIQVPIKEEVGLTFAASLRSILRQDPDKVMVGEIRDLETAEIAVEASLTGHLVLSTLHTNDAPESITRLLDMEVEPFLITSSLEAVLAQRLVRLLCRFCKEEYVPDDEELERFKLDRLDIGDEPIFRKKGCPACEYRGYSGRSGIFELLGVDDEIREMILRYATAIELRKRARAKGMRTLREIGLMKVRQGLTTVKEVGYCTEKYEE